MPMSNQNTSRPNNSSSGESRPRQTILRDDEGLVLTASPVENCVLVGVEIQGEPAPLALEDSLDELALLAKTADLVVVGPAHAASGTASPGDPDRLRQAGRDAHAGHRNWAPMS